MGERNCEISEVNDDFIIMSEFELSRNKSESIFLANMPIASSQIANSHSVAPKRHYEVMRGENLKLFLYEVFLRIRHSAQSHALSESDFLEFAERILVVNVPDQYVLEIHSPGKRRLFVPELKWIYAKSTLEKKWMCFIEFEISICFIAALLNIRLVYMYYLLTLWQGAWSRLFFIYIKWNKTTTTLPLLLLTNAILDRRDNDIDSIAGVAGRHFHGQVHF